MNATLKAGAIAVLLLAATVASGLADACRTLWAVQTGRSPHCATGNALNASIHAARLTETKDWILARSRLIESDPDGYELWDTPEGTYWIPAGNRYTLPFNLAEQRCNLYRRGEVRIRQGDIVLDCGANIGIFTREAVRAGARLVVAIEPAPLNLECLRRNLAPEIEAGRVVVCPKGVWDKEDSLTLRVDPANAAAASFVMGSQDWEAVVAVPLTTIDLLAEELALPRVDFIKMDIEGAEPKALRGARRTLAQSRPRLAISSYHAADHPALIPAEVRLAWPGYRLTCGACTQVPGAIRPDVLFFD